MIEDTTKSARKRRDSLDDAMGAPVSTDEPMPPYIFNVTDLIYLGFAVDRDRAAAILPPGPTLADGAAAVMAFFHTSPQGWGPNGMTAGFAGVAVNEYPSPDTAQSVFAPSGYARGQGQKLRDRHYHIWHPGDVLSRHDGNDVWGAIRNAERRVVADCHIRRYRDLDQTTAGIDRYLGQSQAGKLMSWLISASGAIQRAKLLSLRITENADPAWQALRPRGLTWAVHLPKMLTNQSEPLPVVPDDPLAPAKALREALMGILDRHGRACAILSSDGQILHRNAAGQRRLTRLGLVGAVPMGAEQAQFRAVLAAAAQGDAGVVTRPFLRADAAGAPLILQAAPIDAVLAGPGTALLLIDDPTFTRREPRTELLQLLGLTPAEARIACPVGAGLPSREAAARLGLAESTVRSSLKMILDKLGIPRQAALVQIVARLEAR